MDRAEQTGLGVAVIGHVLLFGALSLNLLKPPVLPKIENPPIEVAMVDEAALKSAAPAPTPMPASPPPEPAPAPVIMAKPTPEPIAPPPVPKVVARPEPKLVPKPVAKAEPKPAQKAVAKAQPKPQPVAVAKSVAQPKPFAKATPTKTASADMRPRRIPGLSRSIVTGLNDAPSETPTKSTTPSPVKAAAKPAKAPGITLAQMTGAQKSSLNALIYRALKPYWKPPSGSDAELLVTRLSVKLNRDGSIDGEPEILGQDGINDSNRGQAKLHAERAIQAVRRAAPFNLPPDYYDGWKWLKPLKLYVGQPG